MDNMIKERVFLRNKFTSETNISWENEQGEPDIDYVMWLEKHLLNVPEAKAVQPPESYPKLSEVCVWIYIERKNDKLLSTDCNQYYPYMSGSLADNRYIYCPYCGKIIKDANFR